MLYEYLAEVLAQHTGITMMAPIPTNFPIEGICLVPSTDSFIRWEFSENRGP